MNATTRAPNAFRIFLASNFEEFKELRSLLKMHLEASYDEVDVINLNDGLADSRDPMTRSTKFLEDADICVVLIGERYGGVPTSTSRQSYAHRESMIALAQRPKTKTLVFQTEKSSSGDKTEIQEWVVDLRQSCTIAPLRGAESADHVRVIKESIEPFYDEWLVPHQAAEGVASLLPATRESHWRPDRVTGFDYIHVGMPAAQLDSRLQGLELLAAQHWNQIRLAFEIGDSTIVRKHLGKILEDQSMNGEACYWAARFDFALPESRTPSAAQLAERSAQIFDLEEKYRSAGAAWLLAAKFWRALDMLSKAEDAARTAVERIGGHSDAHLELCLTLAPNGASEDLLRAGLDTFLRSARAHRRLCNELTRGGNDGVSADLEQRARHYAIRRLAEMQDFRNRWTNAHGSVPEGCSDTVRQDDEHDAMQLMERAIVTSKQHLAWLREDAERLGTEAARVDNALAHIPRDGRPAALRKDMSLKKRAKFVPLGGAVAALAAYLAIDGDTAATAVAVLVGLLALSLTAMLLRVGYLGKRQAETAFTNATHERETNVALARSELANSCARHDQLVNIYEARHLQIAQHSPTSSAGEDQAGDVTRVSLDNPPEDECIYNHSTINPAVHERVPELVFSAEQPRYSLFRMLEGSSRPRLAARWAAYYWEHDAIAPISLVDADHAIPAPANLSPLP